MNQNLALEIKVIQKFIRPEKQERYIQFVTSAKNRYKFTRQLAHLNDLNWLLFDEVKGNEAAVVQQRLTKHRIIASTCYAISENTELDATELDITEAISATVGHQMGTLLIFGDADLVFYEGESMKNRFISK